MLTWPDSPDGLHQMHADFVSRFGSSRALYEIASATGLSYRAVHYRLKTAGIHNGIKRRPRAPGNGICACGAPASAGRYKSQGDAKCFRCYMRAYAADPDSKFKRAARMYIYEVKRNAVCVDCVAEERDGKWPPAVLHFDHVPGRGPKLFNIGNGDYAIETVKAEIAKCDVVCANHHAIRTWISRGKPLDEAV